MASSSSALCEDQLECSICLDVFTDPVSTPCGHNFCMICLKEFWDSSSHCQCPVCKEKFSNRPDLRVNTFISALAATLKKSVQVKSSRAAGQLPSKSKKVLCDSCTEDKLKALKSCLHCGLSFCNTHLMPHKTTAKLMKHKLIEPVENLEDYICQKHERPLELFCRVDQTCVCQFCSETEHKSHNTVPIEEESVEKKNELVKTQAEVQQKIQERLKKIEEIKHSIEVDKINTEKEKADVVKMFSALMRCTEKCQAELLKVMEEKQKAAERQAEEFIKDLEQELSKLKRKNTDLEQHLHTEDHLHLIQIYPSLCSSPHTQDWTSITMTSHLSVETLRKALAQLQETLSQEMLKIDETVDVTLDPDTTHPYLVLSDDGKQVTCGDKRQPLPDNPERFINYCIVLGQEGYSSGRFYYEVQQDMWGEEAGRIWAVPGSGHLSVQIREKADLRVENELVKTQQKIQERLKKIEEIKHSVEINTKKEKSEVVKMFSALMGCTERSQAELLKIYPSLCSSPHTQDWTSITITSHLGVETLRRALAQLQETLSQEIEKIDKTVDVTLDPDTANPYLVLSDDGKHVNHVDKSQNFPDNPERFNYCACVLGKEGFSSGRFYYEVQVKGKTKWDFGVAKESINRKGQIIVRPKDGYWCLFLGNKSKYKACDSPSVSLSLKQAPQKVGVFVDYEKGLVSFYNVDAKSHIYSFTAQTFTEKLYPLFSSSLSYGGKNVAPLIICPVHQI
ncbi:bloodthirsty-relatedprotein family, member 6 [Silurus asotus]|uniref:Bloodthirsty-relatedprotein family, member 6 n=1 Tax=Silurus asotus TaxID=30991 RepID=A0AAD5B264_SILAS|nr:bloodthirsty-relatedprotein family, member 6 [Silurus asotus]